MKDYINGYFVKRGSRPIHNDEIKHFEDLGEGYSYRLGFIPEDGVSIDILQNGKMIAWEHNLAIINTRLQNITDFRIFTSIAEKAVNKLKTKEHIK